MAKRSAWGGKPSLTGKVRGEKSQTCMRCFVSGAGLAVTLNAASS